MRWCNWFSANSDAEVRFVASLAASSSHRQVSGLGPYDHLHEMGIEVKKDLPGVGSNLVHNLFHLFPKNLLNSRAARPLRHPRDISHSDGRFFPYNREKSPPCNLGTSQIHDLGKRLISHANSTTFFVYSYFPSH